MRALQELLPSSHFTTCPALADIYERAMLNGVIGIQKMQRGGHSHSHSHSHAHSHGPELPSTAAAAGRPADQPALFVGGAAGIAGEGEWRRRSLLGGGGGLEGAAALVRPENYKARWLGLMEVPACLLSCPLARRTNSLLSVPPSADCVVAGRAVCGCPRRRRAAPGARLVHLLPPSW